MKIRWGRFVILALACVLLLGSGCILDSGKNKVQLKVIIAGSLLVPFQELEKEFEAQNPDIDVLLEGHGSVQVIRSVTELGNVADLIVVADAQLIPAMMYSTPVSEGGPFYADWLVEFSTNRLGLAYHEKSLFGSEINAANWFEILSKPDVTLGVADPRIDAMGYRTLMTLRLAEAYHDDPGIFDRIISSSFSPPILAKKEDGVDVISVPELLKPVETRIKLRGYSILLMALLESGDLDYAFEYESVAKQRDLEFLALPPEIDLSSPDHEEEYGSVEVKLDFRRFASVFPDFRGARIMYGLSIPSNASYPGEAARFVRFMLGEEGRRIFEGCWQPLLASPLCDDVARLPEALKSLFP